MLSVSLQNGRSIRFLRHWPSRRWLSSENVLSHCLLTGLSLPHACSFPSQWQTLMNNTQLGNRHARRGTDRARVAPALGIRFRVHPAAEPPHKRRGGGCARYRPEVRLSFFTLSPPDLGGGETFVLTLPVGGLNVESSRTNQPVSSHSSTVPVPLVTLLVSPCFSFLLSLSTQPRCPINAPPRTCTRARTHRHWRRSPATQLDAPHQQGWPLRNRRKGSIGLLAERSAESGRWDHLNARK